MKRSILLLALAAFAVSAGEPEKLVVVRGAAPKLDGTLAKDEWKGATRVALDQGALHWRHDDDHLYLGVDLPPGIVSVFALVGEKVFVLHSSARLGTAVYARGKKLWKYVRAFKYEADSDAFLEKEGWRATTMMSGKPGQMEFVLSRKLLKLEKEQRSVRLAVAVFARDAVRWPATLEDDTADARLLMGHTRKTAKFAPETWQLVELPKPAKAIKK